MGRAGLGWVTRRVSALSSAPHHNENNTMWTPSAELRFSGNETLILFVFKRARTCDYVTLGQLETNIFPLNTKRTHKQLRGRGGGGGSGVGHNGGWIMINKKGATGKN